MPYIEVSSCVIFLHCKIIWCQKQKGNSQIGRLGKFQKGRLKQGSLNKADSEKKKNI